MTYLEPKLDELLGKPTMVKKYRDGDTRRFWAFVDGNACYSFTFVVHTDGAKGKRVGKIYSRDP